MKEIGNNLAIIIIVLMIGSCTMANEYYSHEKAMLEMQCEKVHNEKEVRNR